MGVRLQLPFALGLGKETKALQNNMVAIATAWIHAWS